MKKNHVGYYTDSGKALHIVTKALPSSTSLGIGLNATMDDLDDLTATRRTSYRTDSRRDA